MLSFLNFIACKILYPFIKLNNSRIYFSWFRINKGNSLEIRGTQISKSRLVVTGEGNEIVFENCLISDSVFSVSGNNNKIQIAREVNLRKGNIIIRGNNCMVNIGDLTTFGEVRIINVGSNNAVTIGKNCLFSDQIEIWASDSHAIYDDQGIWVNKERPVSIGNGVWVGSKVTILKGVTIADGAIIGMGTLLTRNVPEKTIVAGNPQKVIKEKIQWTLEYPMEGKK